MTWKTSWDHCRQCQSSYAIDSLCSLQGLHSCLCACIVITIKHKIHRNVKMKRCYWCVLTLVPMLFNTPGVFNAKKSSREADLNHRPKDDNLLFQLQSSALPTELSRDALIGRKIRWLLLACGIETCIVCLMVLLLIALPLRFCFYVFALCNSWHITTLLMAGIGM